MKTPLRLGFFVHLFSATALAAQAVQPANVCPAALEALWAQATDSCINDPAGYICNGGSAPAVEPQGAVSNALATPGTLVAVDEVDAMRTPIIAADGLSGGVAFIRVSPPTAYTILLLGDVTVRDLTPPDFPAWTSFAMATDTAFPGCTAAPMSAAILQSPAGSSTRVVVNGVSLALAGTVLVRTDLENTTFVALSGESLVLAQGSEQPLPTGNQLTVQHSPQDYAVPVSPPTVAVPFSADFLQNIPLSLLDRPIILPQPGSVTTQGTVNLRVEPSIYAGVITQVEGGEVLSVLGRDQGGGWYHVRRFNGESGWMSAELLAANVGEIRAIYQSTPMPPQRYGEFATRGRVVAPAGVNLRVGPDGVYPSVGSLNDGTVVNILARSPYSPWVKVEAGGVEGWIALVALETTAYFEALPVDPRAPGPPVTPTPTRIPGSFGNAFPDPNEESIQPP